MSSEKSIFLTNRIADWRKQELNESFTKTLSRIEEFGCEIWSISAVVVTPSFSYTVGIYDTCGHPEIVTIGLKQGTAHHALNEAARKARAGVDLAVGRHAGLVGDVDVEFQPVNPKWLHQIMLRTDWFYKGDDVPVLQLVYPDLQNRFPGETDFDIAFEQPSLSGELDDNESTRNDLWLAYDAGSSLSRWRFPTGPHTSAYLSQTVFNSEEPVTYVSHDDDGAWQFLGDKMSEGGGPVLACLHHPIDADRSLEELHDLPANWYAIREHGSAPWQRFEHPVDEQSDLEAVEPPLLN